MTEEMQVAMREWLRENLLIDVADCDKYGPGASVYVGLRFKGEDAAFTYERIYVPTLEA